MLFLFSGVINPLDLHGLIDIDMDVDIEVMWILVLKKKTP